MPHLTVMLEGDGALREWAAGVSELRPPDDSYALVVVGLAGGMESGAAGVGIAAKLKDGTGVIHTTSLALFLTAADALRNRFGDPREGPGPNPVTQIKGGSNEIH